MNVIEDIQKNGLFNYINTIILQLQFHQKMGKEKMEKVYFELNRMSFFTLFPKIKSNVTILL